MQTIFKYSLSDMSIDQEIELYSGSQILSAIEQDRQIKVYALTDPDEADKRTFHFKVIGTGWNHPANGIDLIGYTFLDTVKLGLFVWHVFWK